MKERKRLLALLLSGVMTLGLFGCGVTTGSGEAAPDKTPAAQDSEETTGEDKSTGTADVGNAEKKTIYIYQLKIQIDEALKSVCKQYSEMHPEEMCIRDRWYPGKSPRN